MLPTSGSMGGSDLEAFILCILQRAVSAEFADWASFKPRPKSVGFLEFKVKSPKFYVTFIRARD